MIPHIAAASIGYLLGSLMLGVPLSRALGGVDIRSVGSGNPGFTNVLRSVGRTAGLLTLVADAGKGILAGLCARAIAGRWGGEHMLLGALACVAAIVGHAFPLFFGFKGGKGVATGAGGFAVLMPAATLAAFGVWLVLLTLTRYMSLASIGGALALPVYLTWIDRPASRSGVLLAVAWLVAIAIVLLHRANIVRLARRTERKFSLKRS